MRLFRITAFLCFVLVFSLSTAAWSYTIIFDYGSEANMAKGFARVTSLDGDYDESKVNQKLNSLQVEHTETTLHSSGGATVWPLTGQSLGISSRIIKAHASAGHTNDSVYEGYSQGIGDSLFGFMILPGQGESAQLLANISFLVTGALKLEKFGNNNLVILDCYGNIANYKGEDILTFEDKQTWKFKTNFNPPPPANLQYANGKTEQVQVETGVFYTMYGFMQVDAQAYGLNFPGENCGEFEAFLSIQPLQTAPLPGAVWLLGGGIACLGLLSRGSSKR